jgi:hypothetical protein
MTIHEAAQRALEVQNGCNLSGIVRALDETLRDVIWPAARADGKGTQWVNQHPIVTLYLDKLCDLNGYSHDHSIMAAHEIVTAMANERIPVCECDNPRCCEPLGISWEQLEATRSETHIARTCETAKL